AQRLDDHDVRRDGKWYSCNRNQRQHTECTTLHCAQGPPCERIASQEAIAGLEIHSSELGEVVDRDSSPSGDLLHILRIRQLCNPIIDQLDQSSCCCNRGLQHL